MLEFTSPDLEDAAAVPREELFSLDGVTHTIPMHFPASVALQYMDAMRKYGPDAAVSWALELALTTEGYTALLGAGTAIPQKGFDQIVTVITSRIMGKAVVVPGPKAPANPLVKASSRKQSSRPAK
jgi:hypothetical protein